MNHPGLQPPGPRPGRARSRGLLPALALAPALAVALLSVPALTGCSPAPGPDAKPGTSPSGSAAAPLVKGAETAADPWFEEVSAAAGVHFRHQSGHRDRFFMPEINTGGAGVLDFDRDGLPDLFCVNGGFADPALPDPPGHRLYRNLGGWRFEDVTARAGVGANPNYGIGAACADYDGDGWTDLLVVNLRTNVLYRNRGDGTFEDVTARAGLTKDPTEWSSSAAFADLDGDGHPDLFVVNYVHWSPAAEVDCFSRGGVPDYCSPLSYRAPARDRLYRNRGDGTFEDVSRERGLDRAFGNGLGVATADFDRDGRIDVFVANDALPNQLWMNRGPGPLQDEALIRGCAVNATGIPRAGMGAVAFDLGDDGWFDLFVTHLVGEGHGLFRNTRGHFADTITPKGPMLASRPFTGFGVAFRDFDHDGEPDLFVAHGRVRLGARDLDPRDPFAEPNLLLRGLGRGGFAEVHPAGGTQPPLLATSRGAAFADFDNDGAEDIAIVNKDGPLHLLRNRVGHRGRWAGFDLRADQGPVALNAVLRTESAGRTRWRQVQPHEGYASSNDPRIVVGLGSAAGIDRVLVRWPDGLVESFGPRPAGAYHPLVRGRGTPIPPAEFW